MSEQMITIIVSALLVMFAMLPFGIEGIKRILEQDFIAVLHGILGLIAIVIGLLLPTSVWTAGRWSAPIFLIAGTISLTFAILVLLPERATLTVLYWRNLIGMLLILVSVYLFWNQYIVPITPAWSLFNQTVSAAWEGYWAIYNAAWNALMASMGWSNLYLFACPCLLFAGIWIFFHGRKDNKEPRPATGTIRMP